LTHLYRTYYFSSKRCKIDFHLLLSIFHSGSRMSHHGFSLIDGSWAEGSHTFALKARTLRPRLEQAVGDLLFSWKLLLCFIQHMSTLLHHVHVRAGWHGTLKGEPLSRSPGEWPCVDQNIARRKMELD